MKEMQTKLVIIGGGPAGMAAAVAAYDAGLRDILILERDCEAEDDGREIDEIENTANQFLEQFLVPEDIKTMLYKAYELLFNQTTDKEISLKIYRAWS